MTIMPEFVPNPSISTSSWLRVCSRSSCPPPSPVPRWRPTASISSIKMIQGEFCLAVLNISRTRLAPTPTNISTKSDPEIEKKGTFASPATALASKVLPVPGGPINKTPLGILAPKAMYFFGFFKKSMISAISSFSSSRPATFLNVVVFPRLSLARLLPKSKALLFPPLLRIKKAMNTMINMIGKRIIMTFQKLYVEALRCV